MFTTAYVIDMPGGEPEAALVGIGEPSEFELMDDDQQLADERVFYYFESLAEINAEHTDWSPDTWFIVAGIDLPCFVCSEVDDGGNQVVPVEVAPDRFGDPIEIEHLARCADCGRKS
jgi:hypothetical protein